MLFKLTTEQENDLLKQPETGMGYQVVEARKEGNYIREKFLVLNSQVAVEMNAYTSDNVRQVVNEGIYAFKAKANLITLNAMSVLNEIEFRHVVNETKEEHEKGAIDNPIEKANGIEFFVRLSAFEDDKRIDKKNGCLRPGSFTTTTDDYLKCKAINDDPIERYALPSNDKIKYAFHIQPLTSDTLQRGKIQPVNGKRGGGKEVYFENGTAAGTFKTQTPY